MKVFEVVRIFRENGLPESEAYIVLKYLTGKPKEFFIAHPEYELKEVGLIDLINLRLKRYPLSYITREKGFFKRNFYVEEGVLIPRPETEMLVEITIDLIKKNKIRKIAEVGVGSGAIIISILLNTDCTGYATDISEKAIKVSKINAKRYGVEGRLKIVKGSYLEPFLRKWDEIELIVSNPPYVRLDATLDLEVGYEPKEALYGGKDGLDFYRNFLKMYDFSGKIVVMEIGHDQGEWFKRKGWEVIKDYSGQDRIVIKDFRR
ncbi:SAM-dependent methyltransferase [Thermosipho melanesiensis]|uniref:peptide chain release factor N(5)-glutamine methyltransferase n=2 Tax=Thermosipho melanesiensis TaxID=46541 RepID=A6LMW7_THEM4|nr:peptide chain release factor N(5)-glutamine methyltransferase [Thermosipho melanesiensis]ABR31268.1 modification methylase, HemK family [Thermosipho melanesiensis BI429]APT74349.1 SAM-dependent methyltransferase [Thermosipho melanesiensis]OOC36291.1 SAM-dependent methyltransferase [Thermosipho melanesiensis]OOC37109.1 SAM-dependent methyltransferase [Thermosipho melanesiensis]OOC37861.1 SAM-dependent methyltransferase [Thermosipho melanesiensis]